MRSYWHCFIRVFNEFIFNKISDFDNFNSSKARYRTATYFSVGLLCSACAVVCVLSVMMRIGRAIILNAFLIPLRQYCCGMASKVGETKYAYAWFMLAITPFTLISNFANRCFTKIGRALRRLTELYEDWPRPLGVDTKEKNTGQQTELTSSTQLKRRVVHVSGFT